MININSKLPTVGTTIFTVMSKLAQDHNAINLSQGFPDYPADKKLIEYVDKAMKDGHNQYAPMTGLPILRELVADKMLSLYGANYDAENEITITAGGTQAIFTALAAVINPGDEVIIFEPAYDSYSPTIKLLGGLVKPFELHAPGYHIDWEMVKKLFSANTKMIILNSPQNPTGSILSKNDIDALIKLTKDTDILILSDEVYEHIIYDGEQHESVALYPELQERSFVIASFGKLLHTTGWKLGYCLAPAKLTTEFRKIHQFNVFSVNTPMQMGIANYLKHVNVFDNLYVNNVQGTAIPLSQLASLKLETSALSINHQNKVRTISVNSFVQKGYLNDKVIQDVETQMAKISPISIAELVSVVELHALGVAEGVSQVLFAASPLWRRSFGGCALLSVDNGSESWRVISATGMSRMSRFWRRIRYSNRSSGPSNASRMTSSASGGM